jgi:hypothetical protein
MYKKIPLEVPKVTRVSLYRKKTEIQLNFPGSDEIPLVARVAHVHHYWRGNFWRDSKPKRTDFGISR